MGFPFKPDGAKVAQSALYFLYPAQPYPEQGMHASCIPCAGFLLRLHKEIKKGAACGAQFGRKS
jgi:hypothetical protein